MKLTQTLPILALCALPVIAADEASSAKQIYDRQLTNTEREVVGLVEAMPAGKFSFAPTSGDFKGVRPFGVQAKHVAYIMNQISAALLGQTLPPAEDDNGPAGMTRKEDIVKYLKDAFAQAHKAIGTLTNQNLLEQTASPFNPGGKQTRLQSVDTYFWHTYDHYGQMVVYLRMNDIIPPASRPRGQ
jgi:DinB superfamily